MGVIDRLSTWFSDSTTVSYLAGNAGLSKKLGHCFGALLSVINKLPGLSFSDPSGVYAEGSSSCSDVAGFISDVPSTHPHPSVTSRDQDSIMATPHPLKRCLNAFRNVSAPHAPPIPASAPVKSAGARVFPPPAQCSYAQAACTPSAVSGPPSLKAKSLVHLTRAFPSLSADKILVLHHQASGTPKKGSKSPGCMTGGPSHCFLILCFGDSDMSFNVIAMALSHYLVLIKSCICVESFRPAYGRLLIITTLVSSSSDIQVMEDFIRTQVLKGSVVECEISFSCSFLRIVRAPFLLTRDHKLTPKIAFQVISSSTFAVQCRLAAAPSVV